MADFKDEISVGLAGNLAGELSAAWPDFPRRRFTQGLGAALAPLELMARVNLLAERLTETLPEDFGTATDVLRNTLRSPSFDGWMTLPCGTFVALAGIDHPKVALPLLAELTPRWSSEGPIRPFIERHPETTYEHLRRWATHPDEHVRRLVSEGTRPRLPWAPQLRGLIADPTPNLALLEQLVADPSAYVRRSVANHLNDISKDHPDVAIRLARAWLPRGDGPAWVVRHGLRTLIKRGDPDALALVGVSTDAPIDLAAFTADRATISIGDAVAFTVTLALRGTKPADAVIDYRIHYVGAKGVRRPKVFKLARRRLEPGAPATISKRHRFEHVSIRRIHPGRHTLDVQVNGRVLGALDIDVVEPASAPDPVQRPTRSAARRQT